MAERERKQREQQEADQEMPRQKRAQDIKVSHKFKPTMYVTLPPSPSYVHTHTHQFHRQQQDKAERIYQEAKDLQQFHRNQRAEWAEQRAAEREEERQYTTRNRELLEVSTQLLQYAVALLY